MHGFDQGIEHAQPIEAGLSPEHGLGAWKILDPSDAMVLADKGHARPLKLLIGFGAVEVDAWTPSWPGPRTGRRP